MEKMSKETENESNDSSSKRGCLYAILIFLGVVGMLVLVKTLFM